VKTFRAIIVVLVCFLNLGIVNALSLKKGLFFHSHEANIEARTSLLLNNGEPYNLHSKDVISIDFDICLRDEKIKFGYLFRIISNDNENFDLLVNNDKELFFVVNKKDFYKKENLLNNQKLNVKVIFDKQENEIRLNLNNDSIICKHDLSAISSLLINFGECKVKGFKSNDVPPIILDNITIHYKDKLMHDWQFDRYAENTIYDEVENRGAIFRNGKMLIDNSTHWQKLASLEAKVFPQITFDSISNKVYVLNDQKCLTYSVADNTLDSFEMKKNAPGDLYMNHFIYDYTSRNLLSYNFNPQRLNFYNKETSEWKDIVEELPDYSQHNNYISVKDTSLYLFGGYGHYQYKGNMFKVNLISGKWQSWDFSPSITPRYLAAMGGNKKGDKLYILGGRGAELGRQELSPRNFFDLFEVNLNSMTVKLIYELPEELIDKDCAFSNSLVVDEDNESLYVLAYPNTKYSSYIVLKRLGLNKPSFETYCDTIDYYFRDISSYSDLYYSPSLSKLIAVTAYSEDNENTSVNIYSLDFPPLKESDVSQLNIQASQFGRWKIITSIIVVFLSSIALVWLYKRRKKEESYKEDDEYEDKSSENEIQFDINAAPEEIFYERHKSSILFLGGFQIYNKNGKDITGDFTPTLKFLLVLILLYSIKDEKGISSIKLQELLWFDKSEEAARNNRNVNLRKLRILLEDVGNVEISNKNSYWTIILPDNIFSDYQEILKLIAETNSSQSYEVEKLNRLLELLSFGDLLPNIQYEWIDNFKSDFSNMVIDILIQFADSNNQAINNNKLLLMKIADVILTFDPINEEAIAVKCQVLYQIGKKALAKTVYNSFTKSYEALLGEKYEISLKQLLDKKT